MDKTFKRKRNGTNGNNNKNSMALDTKKKLFVELYLKDFNATRAYMKAYNTENVDMAGSEGSTLLRVPRVMEQIDSRINKMLNKLEVTNEAVLGEYAKLAFMDTRSMFINDVFIGMNQLNIAQQSCVESIEVTEVFSGNGEEREVIGYKTKVKFYSRKGALENFMKYLGMMPTNQQNTYIINREEKKIELTVAVDDFKEKHGVNTLNELYKMLGGSTHT